MSKTLEAITLDVLELSRSQRLAPTHIIFDLDEGPVDPDAETACSGAPATQSQLNATRSREHEHQSRLRSQRPPAKPEA
jgi:hypothetical protein